MGLPLAFTIGLVTLVTSYVPYLGALVSGLFALLIAFGAGGPLVAVIMVVVVLVAQNVVQPIIQRQLERNTMDIHPIVSFGSTIVGGVVAGVLGATLSAPFVAMVLRIRQRVAAYHVEEGEPTSYSTAPLSGAPHHPWPWPSITVRSPSVVHGILHDMLDVATAPSPRRLVACEARLLIGAEEGATVCSRT